MFDESRKRRKLRREISVLEKETVGWDWRSDEHFGEDSEQAKEQKNLRNELDSHRHRLDAIETERLMKKVRRLGIELPSKNNWWWDNLDQAGADDYHSYLTDVGKAGVSKLIREERRKSIEWWVKIIAPLLPPVISIIGLLVALLTVIRR